MSLSYRDCEERYRRDATFAAMINSLLNIAENLQMSPGELREAAVFAEVLFYRTHPLPYIWELRPNQVNDLKEGR